MFRFEDFEPSHFLEFLKQGLLDEHIKEILERFYLFSPKLQFEILLYLRERLKDVVSPSFLAKGLSIKKEDAERIIKGEGKICEIIVAGKEQKTQKISCSLVKALVIPETSKVITNLEHLKRKLSIIKKLVNQNFAVFFESSFGGDSFMLPLAVTLSIKKIPDDLRFTGKLNSKGDILDVDFIQEKVSFAQSNNLRLITPLQVKKFDTIKKYLEKEVWDVPFYVTSSGKEEVHSFLEVYKGEKEFAEFPILKGVELFYGLSEEDFYMITGQLQKQEDWERVSQEFYYKIYKIRHFLPGVKTFHLGFRTASALSFALGVLFSHFDPFVVYHYQVLDGVATYHPIEVLTPRTLKERISEFKLINPIFEDKGEDLVVILNFSHHELTADVKAYVASFLKDPSFVILESEYKGNLPVELFHQVAKESASFLQNIREKKSFKSYHFFFSCPVVIAFMIGIAFGHYVDGFMYNFQKGTALYEPVLSFKFLRKIRETDVRF
jgi:hypothetical protein